MFGVHSLVAFGGREKQSLLALVEVGLEDLLLLLLMSAKKHPPSLEGLPCGEWPRHLPRDTQLGLSGLTSACASVSPPPHLASVTSAKGRVALYTEGAGIYAVSQLGSLLGGAFGTRD